MKNVFIYKNNNPASVEMAERLAEMLSANDLIPVSEFSQSTDFVIAIGGDGSFLRALQACNYADIPVLGIKTGHLGFFCELSCDDQDTVLDIIKSGKYAVQKHRTIRTEVSTVKGDFVLEHALNDVLVKKDNSSLTHFKLSIGDSFIENFSGDGLLIASSAGSTAYNYALGGSIVDPRLDLLQITPMAPANNATYRNFTSSLLAPPDQKILLEPIDAKKTVVITDGLENHYEDVTRISVSLSDNEIQIVRLPEYDFWGKVKSKFL